jgi:hypothetical protein
MTHVEGFDNLDDMFAAMGAAEDVANHRLSPGQERLRDNTLVTGYWAQALPDIDLVVYGKTPPSAETQVGAGFDVAENRARGYLTGIGFSADCPYGEGGDTHVSQVVPITERVFVMAQLLRFPTYSMLREDYNIILGVALAECERLSLGRE